VNQTMIASTNSIAAGMLEEFERELPTTRKFLERLPQGNGADADDKLSWKPHPKSMSAGQLGYHIAQTPGLALRMALQDRTSPPSSRVREQAATVRELLALLDDSAAFVRDTLPMLDDIRMRGVLALDLPGGSAIELPRAQFLRSVMLNHWYHHRGQLGVYLRLLGVSVPSSYGPSGDESGAA
jgi:uncharacterized damage-inducible protein DinB